MLIDNKPYIPKDINPNVLDIFSGTFYQLPEKPEELESFATKMMRTSKGKISSNSTLIGDILIFLSLNMLMLFFLAFFTGPVAACIRIFLAAGIFLLVWYNRTWYLSYDGSTGFVEYHTMFRGTESYHVSELMNFEIRDHHFRGRIAKDLVIHVPKGDIGFTLMHDQYAPCHDSDVAKFHTYLQLYRIFGSESGE